jgi:hypothetical protein
LVLAELRLDFVERLIMDVIIYPFLKVDCAIVTSILFSDGDIAWGLN